MQVLIHCMSWSAFGGVNARKQSKLLGLNPQYIVECFRSENNVPMVELDPVLIHCVSWNAFGVSALVLAAAKAAS